MLETCCYDCTAWCGRCKLGKVNRIARDSSCELFDQKNGVGAEKQEKAMSEKKPVQSKNEDKEKVAETAFLDLKYEKFHGLKIGDYGIAFKTSNDPDKFQQAYGVLSEAKATIKDRYHGKGYTNSYWLYEDGKIYQQKIKETQH